MYEDLCWIVYDFLAAYKNDKKADNARKAIQDAIQKTQAFKNERIEKLDENKNNVYGCKNSECAHLAKAWSKACKLMNEVDNQACLGLESKLEFWTNERLRESVQIGGGGNTKTLEEIERQFFQNS